ncbi:hypothetical protein [Sorangium sp. So ce1000]|uniref:hypothetical protein n=1 Tax=Sorangium sp. So ce1000 TaxID=3133325 RepID=UPI003F62A4E9
MTEEEDGEDEATVARKPRTRAGMALGVFSLGLGVIGVFFALDEDRSSPTSTALPAVAATATAPTSTRTPAEQAEWRAKQHARIEAARLEGGAALARGDFELASIRLEEGFRVAQDVLAQADEDGDATLDAAIMLIELADLERKRGNEGQMTQRRRGADVLLTVAKHFGVTDQQLLDATLARSHEMGGPAP